MSEPASPDRPSTSVRVVLAEDEVLLREGLTRVLSEDGFVVVAAVGDAPALLAAVDAHRPDLVVTDIRMPPDSDEAGLRAAIEIRARWPRTGVMVLSQHVAREYATELLQPGTGGVGYLLKQRVADIGRFRADLRRVASGGIALDPDVVSAMMARATRTDRRLERLTGRQREVLELIAEGRSNGAIAAKLSIAEKSVVQHISNIYDQLDLPVNAGDHRRVLAALLYRSS